jgi:hypothetical protein
MVAKNKFDVLLKRVYYNTKSPACFAGVRPIFKEAKRHNPKIKFKDVLEFLQRQDIYTLNKPVRRKFPRNKTIASGFDTDWQVDLADMQSLKSENDGFGWILTCIDVLSRYVWAVPLKTKKPEHVSDGFKQIISTGRMPWKIYSDKGLEFVGKPFQEYLKEKDIIHITPNNPDIKCGLVENFNRNLKTRIWKLFAHQKNYRWVDELPNIVSAINNSYHRTIKMRPCDVTRENAKELWNLLYNQVKGVKDKFKFEVGDHVRITKHKYHFEKGYLGTFTKEIFTIVKRINRYPPVYKIEDHGGEPIEGVFYETELIKVVKEDEIYKVEKVIRKRKRKGVTELFVKWDGWPDKFNSWIQESDLVSA